VRALWRGCRQVRLLTISRSVRQSRNVIQREDWPCRVPAMINLARQVVVLYHDPESYRAPIRGLMSNLYMVESGQHFLSVQPAL
jgi:hypothetical protein